MQIPWYTSMGLVVLVCYSGITRNFLTKSIVLCIRKWWNNIYIYISPHHYQLKLPPIIQKRNTKKGVKINHTCNPRKNTDWPNPQTVKWIHISLVTGQFKTDGTHVSEIVSRRNRADFSWNGNEILIPGLLTKLTHHHHLTHLMSWSAFKICTELKSFKSNTTMAAPLSDLLASIRPRHEIKYGTGKYINKS